MPKLSLPHVFEPGTGPQSPPLLLLHGTGGTEHDLLPLGRDLSPGSARLSPRGAVNERGAARFFARLAEGVFDPEEIRRRTQALADFIVAAASHYDLDLSRLRALGFSNGANVAATLLLLRPEVLGGGGVLLRPMVVLDEPAASASLAGRRVLLLNGQHDPLVPLDHPPRLAALLEAGGARVDLELLPASHGLSRGDFTALHEWWARQQDQVAA
jgi:phospholipase/carboxylesterase